jgi:hypothetical protein
MPERKQMDRLLLCSDRYLTHSFTAMLALVSEVSLFGAASLRTGRSLDFAGRNLEV